MEQLIKAVKQSNKCCYNLSNFDPKYKSYKFNKKEF